MNLEEKKKFIDALAALRTLQNFCEGIHECHKCPFEYFCCDDKTKYNAIPDFCKNAIYKAFLDEVIE